MTTTEKQDLRKTIAEGLAACRKITICETLHIVSPELADELVSKALKAGKTITENGISQWVEESEIINPGQFGSALYTWKGDKIKVDVALVTRTADGTVTKLHKGTAWRKY